MIEISIFFNECYGVGVLVRVTVGVIAAREVPTRTESNVAVVITALLWLVTARPTYTFDPIAIVAEPIKFQVVPLLDW